MSVPNDSVLLGRVVKPLDCFLYGSDLMLAENDFG
jgi:hypothetical protein